MKRVGIGIVLLLGIGQARAQFLGGIFSQGATELKNNAAQIAVLQALGATSQEDYAALENGLTDIGTIHGAEYALHQGYFASLVAVNASVAGMPEVADIMTAVPAGLGSLSAAIGRWSLKGGMTSGELAAVTGLDSSFGSLGLSELQALQVVLTAGQLTMSDAERMARVRALDRAVREQYVFIQQTCAEGDLLVAQRRQAAGQVGAVFGTYGMR